MKALIGAVIGGGIGLAIGEILYHVALKSGWILPTDLIVYNPLEEASKPTEKLANKEVEILAIDFTKKTKKVLAPKSQKAPLNQTNYNSFYSDGKPELEALVTKQPDEEPECKLLTFEEFVKRPLEAETQSMVFYTDGVLCNLNGWDAIGSGSEFYKVTEAFGEASGDPDAVYAFYPGRNLYLEVVKSTVSYSEATDEPIEPKSAKKKRATKKKMIEEEDES